MCERRSGLIAGSLQQVRATNPIDAVRHCEVHGRDMSNVSVPIEYLTPDAFRKLEDPQVISDFKYLSRTFCPNYDRRITEVDPDLDPFAEPEATRPTHKTIWVCTKCSNAASRLIAVLTTWEMRNEIETQNKAMEATQQNAP
jgi:hypothetical protein